MLHLTLLQSEPRTNRHVLARLGGLARTFWVELRQRRRARATVFMLRALDDRTLKDIGIDRGEIESVVYTRGAGRKAPSIDFGGAPRG